VTNEDSGDVTVLDANSARVLFTIPVGKRPRGVHVQGKLLYVALSGTPKGGPGVDELKLVPDRSKDGIAVIDLARRKLLKVLPSGHDPESFDVAGSMLVVSNEDSAQASFVDVPRGEVVASIAVGGEPEGVATHPNGHIVYMTSESDSRVDVLDVDKREVIATFVTGARPRGIAFTPDGTRAFVTNEMGASVTVVDAIEHKALQDLPLPGEPRARPMGARVSPDGKTLWVSTGRAKTVVAIDVASLAITRTIGDVGVRPWGLDLTPDGKLLYVATGPSNEVAVIDTARGVVTKRVRAGSSPWGVAIAR
jgi:YVTN family beta-propeller protein